MRIRAPAPHEPIAAGPRGLLYSGLLYSGLLCGGLLCGLLSRMSPMTSWRIKEPSHNIKEPYHKR
jgi:hypothetical protein